MIPLSYNLRNLAVRKTTTAAAAGGLGLVVCVFATVAMLSNGIQKTLGRGGSPDAAIVLRQGSDAEMSSGIDTENVGLLLASQGVQKAPDGRPLGVGEVVVVVLLDKTGTDGFSNVTVRGTTDNVFDFRSSAKIIAGRKATPGTDEVVIGKAIRGRFKGLELDQSFDLKKNRPVKVVGVFDDGGSSFDSEVWADLDALRSAFGREGFVSSVRVKLESPAKFDAFKAQVETNKQLGMMAQRETEFLEKQSEGTNTFISTLGYVIAFFFSVAAMIGAMITMHASVANRSREIGTLRALGFSRFAILTSFLFEAVVLALLGGVVGSLAALPMGLVKFSTMNFATWSEIVFTFEPTPAILLRSMILAGVMGLVGGFLPALRAARMSPIQAMRGN